MTPLLERHQRLGNAGILGNDQTRSTGAARAERRAASPASAPGNAENTNYQRSVDRAVLVSRPSQPDDRRRPAVAGVRRAVAAGCPQQVRLHRVSERIRSRTCSSAYRRPADRLRQPRQGAAANTISSTSTTITGCRRCSRCSRRAVEFESPITENRTAGGSRRRDRFHRGAAGDCQRTRPGDGCQCVVAGPARLHWHLTAAQPRLASGSRVVAGGARRLRHRNQSVYGRSPC